MTSTKIRVGILGVHPERGWALSAHIPALRWLSSQYEITAITGGTHEQAQAAANKFGIPHALTSTAELVNHPDVDLVVVAVKVTNHRELIMAAIDAGKAVYSEWPLAVDLEQASLLAALARERRVHTAIGLQTRAAPAFNYVRDLIKAGYVGEVLSTSLLGSGISWGETIEERFRYTLDPASGADMLHVTFAHSIDAVLYALDTTLDDLVANWAIRRNATRIAETGESAVVRTPDQIAVSGTLGNGAFLATHFRGGLSKGTNFLWEINGSRGDLIISAPVGYVGGGFRVQGASGEPLHDLAIPDGYGTGETGLGVAQNVALAYQQLASDLRTGSRLVPSFEDAVVLHRLIAGIERKSAAVRLER